MDLGLQGKVALVAASSKGLGRAIAAELAAEGTRVVISGCTEETLSRVAAEMTKGSGSEVRYRVALMSFVRLIRNVLPHMRERGGGRILNVASSSIKQPIENLMLSNTFRAGIAGLAKSLSTELAPDGILINTLGPERIHTERSASLELAQAEARGIPAEEVRTEFAAKIALGRYGSPEEFAKVVAFLASPTNTYTTGQAILVDGGMVRAL